MIQKDFINADQLNLDSFALAKKIYDSGFRPDAIIALWRGGSLVGIAVQEFFAYKKVPHYHSIVKTFAYQGIDQRSEVEVEPMEHIFSHLSKKTKVLLVDDIFDTGSTIQAVKKALEPLVAQIKTAVVFYKPKRRLVDFSPDYYLHETDSWLVLPHELLGLTDEELKIKDSRLHKLL